MGESAYEHRTMQLRDARVALVDAVSALTEELAVKQRERDQAMAENRELRELVRELEGELHAARNAVAALSGTTAIRWTAAWRRLAGRIRTRIK